MAWQVTQDFIVNGSSKNAVNSTGGEKKNLNRNKTWLVQGDIIKVWLEGPWLSSVFNIFKKLAVGRTYPRYVYPNLFGGAYFIKCKSKSMQHNKENLFKLYLKGYISTKLLKRETQISRLFRVRSSLTFRHLWSVDLLWNAYVTW